MERHEAERLLAGRRRWRWVEMDAASTHEQEPGTRGGPERQRYWFDRERRRWRSEGEGSVAVVNGDRWWVRSSPDARVLHHDGTGDPCGLCAPFVAAMLSAQDLLEPDIALRLLRRDTWIGRACAVLDVTSTTNEAGSLPHTLEVAGAEGCWDCERYELWIDEESGIVLRLLAYAGRDLVVERRVLELHLDRPIPDDVFVYEIPPGAGVIDAGWTHPAHWD